MTHIRQGPYYSGFLGLVQPFCDALKLYRKGNKIIFRFNNFIYNFLPYLILVWVFFLWGLLPVLWIRFDIRIGILFLIFILSLSSLFILIISWFSNCKYSIIGGLRGVSQIISYEVCFGFCILLICCVIKNLNFLKIFILTKIFYTSILPIFFIWLFCILSESNRPPFDFIEGERELVSGFNTEYSGGPFALCFIREYISILFIGIITWEIFIKFDFFIGLGCFFFCFFFIIIRCFLPRLRYDKLIYLCWKYLCPFLIIFLIFFFGLF